MTPRKAMGATRVATATAIVRSSESGTGSTISDLSATSAPYDGADAGDVVATRARWADDPFRRRGGARDRVHRPRRRAAPRPVGGGGGRARHDLERGSR